jgi:heme oxygenase (mycobilin-producing)
VSIVKINVLEVPEGRGEVLEQRFAARAGEVEKVEGFESFELLRPTDGTDRYLVVTRWRDEAAFQAWLSSSAFTRGHAGGPPPQGGEGGAHGEDGGRAHAEGSGHAHGEGGGHPHGEGGTHPHGGGEAAGQPGGGPAAVGSELWGFEIVTSATADATA